MNKDKDILRTSEDAKNEIEMVKEDSEMKKKPGRTGADDAISPNKIQKSSAAKGKKNLKFREYEVSGLAMLENGFDEQMYVKSFNLTKEQSNNQDINTIVPSN